MVAKTFGGIMYIKRENRGAEIHKTNTESCEMYVVDFYENDMIVETRELPGKSIYYAQDAAENWLNGVLKVKSAN